MKAGIAVLAAASTAAVSLALGGPAVAQSSEPQVGVDQFVEVLTPDAREALVVTPADQLVSVIVRLDDQVDLGAVLAESSEADGSSDVIRSLQEKAARDQALFRMLAPVWESGPELESFTPFWIMNGFAITATPGVIASIARFPSVAEIDIERSYQIAGVAPEGPPSSNLEAIGAPQLWSDGFTGEGVVVGVLDTGVDIDGIPGVSPSEVAGSYRGGSNSWFDPYGGSARPYDLDGHGTAIADIISGRDLSGTSVGVAPGSKWIAAKIFDDRGVASTSAIHSALQWMLDPDGDPSTDDGADVVNASWTSSSPGCDTEFAGDISAMRAAGVIPVFAAGNFGPYPASSPSPSNLPGALAVGAVQADLSIVPSSSRGPSECGDATRTYPHLVAPGDGVPAQSLQGQFLSHTGTSFAAPHVAGAIALLISSSPSSTDSEIEAALVGGATDLGDVGADDVFGAGLIDIVRAAELLAGPMADPTASITGSVFNDADRDGLPDEGDSPTGSVQITIHAAGDDGELGTVDDPIAAEVVTDPDGTWRVTGLDPGIHRVVVSATSLPADSVLTGPGSVDIELVAGVESTVVFGWHPPDPGSLTVNVFDDTDGDGLRGPAEPGLAGISVSVEAAGADHRFGTLDDAETVTGLTDGAGVFSVAGLPPGPGRAILDSSTLPERGFVSGVSSAVVDIASDATVSISIAVHVPSQSEPLAWVSYKRAGRANAGDLAFRDEDILSFDGFRFDMFFDGSDVGLAGRDIDAFDILDDHTILLSLDRATDIAGIGMVEDSDILRFEAQQLGESTRGEFLLEVDASDLGFVGTAADIDALTSTADGLLVSIRGNITIDGAGDIRDEDLVLLELESTGADTIGTVSRWFDGSVEGMQALSADIDAAAVVSSDLFVSTLGLFSAPGISASDGDIVSCGGFLGCQWRSVFPAALLGLPGADIDGLALPKGPDQT